MPAVESFVTCQAGCIFVDPRRFTSFATCPPVSCTCSTRQALPSPPHNNYFFRLQGKVENRDRKAVEALPHSHPGWTQPMSDMKPCGGVTLCSHQRLSAALTSTRSRELCTIFSSHQIQAVLFPQPAGAEAPAPVACRWYLGS